MRKSLLVINVTGGETRVALVEDGVIVELHVERTSSRTTLGNVYLGQVTRVLPGMQAAFVDIGLERAAFLHVEDVIRPRDLDGYVGDEPKRASGAGSELRVHRSTPIREVLREGQSIIVQVSKEPIGTKGARVTSHVTLAGRYVVYMPTVDHVGVSRRIDSEAERDRLRAMIELERPPKGGIIARTAADGISRELLTADIEFLAKQWDLILGKRDAHPKPPGALHAELDLVLRAARDLYREDVEKIAVDDAGAFERLDRFVRTFLPDRATHIEHYRGAEPIFDAYGIEDEIRRALARKVSLPSGGTLIIDQAEALTAIDVNTGRFVGKGSKDQEETILKTNLEAVEEIAYQLRLRNIGGLIVLDMIDMVRPSNREKVRRRLEELLQRDSAKTSIHPISELGLIEMTRKRTQESLARVLYEPCFYCDGTGQLLSRVTVAHEILRQAQRETMSLSSAKILVHAHPAVVDVLRNEEREALRQQEHHLGRRMELVAHPEYHIEQFDLQAE